MREENLGAWCIEAEVAWVGIGTPGEGRASTESSVTWGFVPSQGSWSQLCRCPQRVSWLVGWLSRVLCAESLSKEEEEEMPALLYITLCHLPRRRDTAVGKTAFTHSFVSGPECKPEAVGFG